MKTVTRLAAIVSFLFCLIAGLWILVNVGFKQKADGLWTGIGLYFVGKAFFVGPMLLIAGEQLNRKPAADVRVP